MWSVEERSDCRYGRTLDWAGKRLIFGDSQSCPEGIVMVGRDVVVAAEVNSVDDGQYD